jgi:hypothetical protein
MGVRGWIASTNSAYIALLLQCNHPGCGMKVELYRGRTGRVLQKWHIQQFHLRTIAEDICPLSCPVRGCDKWGSTRRDSHSLQMHIDKVSLAT